MDSYRCHPGHLGALLGGRMGITQICVWRHLNPLPGFWARSFRRPLSRTSCLLASGQHESIIPNTWSALLCQVLVLGRWMDGQQTGSQANRDSLAAWFASRKPAFWGFCSINVRILLCTSSVAVLHTQLAQTPAGSKKPDSWRGLRRRDGVG